MTPCPSTIPTHSLVGQSIDVRWPAMIDAPDRPRAVDVVVRVHMVDLEHPLLEAWCNGPDGTKRLVARQPIAVEISTTRGLVHLDGSLHGERVVALSFEPGPEPRLAYAQTPLLAAAGIPAAGHDPPNVRLSRVESDVATA